MPKVTEAHREARRDEIVLAALRVFATKGYQRASMSDIIAESGLSAGAIYGYFEGKRELFLSVAQVVIGRRRDELETAMAQAAPPTPGEAIALLLRGVLDSGVDPGLLVQMWGEATTDPDIRRLANDAADLLRGVLGDVVRVWYRAHPEALQGTVEEAVERLVPVMISCGQGYMVQHAFFDEFDDDAYFAAVAEVLPH